MKIALVTGANRGLGFETAKQLAEHGFKVYMAARDEEKGKAAADILKSEGLNVVPVKLDVTKTSAIREFADILKNNNEPLDLLINNAGVFLESDGPHDLETSSVLKVDPVIILKTIETNTMGPLKLVQSLVPQLLESKDARIINISSGMGQLKDMGGHWPGYRMSKTALNSLTKILAAELPAISINSVCPGWCRTDMGGSGATNSVSEGVETTLWLATMKKPSSGKFYQGKKEIDW